MPLIVNGTTIPEVYGKLVVGGTKVKKVVANGTTVWEAWKPEEYDKAHTVWAVFPHMPGAAPDEVIVTYESKDVAYTHDINATEITGTDGKKYKRGTLREDKGYSRYYAVQQKA